MTEHIRIERQPRKSGGPRRVFIYKCSHPDCEKEVKVRAGEQGIKSGKCMQHAQIKRPYEFWKFASAYAKKEEWFIGGFLGALRGAWESRQK